jgi:hypothetical protein
VTILSPQTLLNVLDLMADGCTVVETTTAIGGAPKSKIIFAWLADSESAGEFDPPPSESSPWCITWRDKLEWFHLHYRVAVADGKEVRKARKSPLRAELEQRLAAKRAAPPAKVSHMPPTPTPRMVAPPSVYDAPAPPPRPAYAYRRPLDAVNTNHGPPEEGRFTVATHRYSLDERRGGKPEVTDAGIVWH